MAKGSHDTEEPQDTHTVEMVARLTLHHSTAGSGDGTAMNLLACLNLLTPSPVQSHQHDHHHTPTSSLNHHPCSATTSKTRSICHHFQHTYREVKEPVKKTPFSQSAQLHLIPRLTVHQSALGQHIWHFNENKQLQNN